MGTSTVSGPFRSENGFQELVNGQWVPVAGTGGGGGGPVCTQYLTVANAFACYSYDTSSWICSNPAQYVKLYQPSAPGVVRIAYDPNSIFDPFYGFRTHAIRLPDLTPTVVQQLLLGPTTVYSEYFGDPNSGDPISPTPFCGVGVANYYNNGCFETPDTVYLSRTEDPFITVDFCFYGYIQGPPGPPYFGACAGIWRQVTPILNDFCGGYLNPRVNPVCQY